MYFVIQDSYCIHILGIRIESRRSAASFHFQNYTQKYIFTSLQIHTGSNLGPWPCISCKKDWEIFLLGGYVLNLKLRIPFPPRVAEYIFISSKYGTFSRIDYMLSHKTRVNTFKKVEITTLFQPQCYESRVQQQKTNWKTHKCTHYTTYLWRTKESKKKSKGKLKIPLNKWKWKYNLPELVLPQKQLKKEVLVINAYIKKRS